MTVEEVRAIIEHYATENGGHVIRQIKDELFNDIYFLCDFGGKEALLTVNEKTGGVLVAPYS